MAYSATPFSIAEHRDEISKLWRENMSDPRIADAVPERLEWFYVENPAGPANTWLGLHAESNAVIGCGSFFPRTTMVGGRAVKAGVLSDFAVTKRHRLAGAAIAIQRALAKNSRAAGFEFLYGYPNEGSVAVCKRVGYKTVGETRTWVKPLHAEYKVKEHLRAPLAVAAVSSVIDVGLKAMDLARGLRAARGLRVEVLERADARFDALWDRAKNAFGIMGEKTAAYLNWRYARFTTSRHLFVCLADRGAGLIRGYAVYSVEGNKALVRDLFVEDMGPTAQALLLGMSDLLRAEGRSSIVLSYIGGSAFAEALRAAGFLERPGGRSLVTYLDPALDEGFKQKVLDAAAWFMIDGELDI